MRSTRHQVWNDQFSQFACTVKQKRAWFLYEYVKENNNTELCMFSGSLTEEASLREKSNMWESKTFCVLKMMMMMTVFVIVQIKDINRGLFEFPSPHYGPVTQRTEDMVCTVLVVRVNTSYPLASAPHWPLRFGHHDYLLTAFSPTDSWGQWGYLQFLWGQRSASAPLMESFPLSCRSQLLMSEPSLISPAGARN